MRFLPADPLASRAGRMASFFLLYVSEGLPYGFSVTAVATQMRRLGVGPAEIGAFVGALYLPWAFKWAVGPIVDSFTVARFGPRRFWIVLTQALMVLTLLVAFPIDFASNLGLFTVIIVVLNACAATQDVAIDALACNTLSDEERGLGNGFMFAGQSVGIALGGGGVLFLTSVMPFRATFLIVAAALVVIALMVSLRIKEAVPAPGGARLPGGSAALERLRAFVREVRRAFTGSRAAMFGVLFAALPMGALALGLALQSNLAVELAMSDSAIGSLAMVSALTGAVGCITGGWISDRIGRRRAVAIFIAMMSIPGIALGIALLQAGVVQAVDAAPGVARAAPAAGVVGMFWVACIAYNFTQGLMYGASTALFMDITTPRVAATQFTAYMALSNLAISMSATWQGQSIERFGYPNTLWLDATVGLVCLLVLPLVAPPRVARRTVGVAPPSGPTPGAAIPEGVVR